VSDASGRSLRVLAVIASSELGGAERVLASLLEGLDRHRFELFVACHGHGPMLEEYRRHAAAVWTLDLVDVRNPRAVRALADLMRRLQCHVVHSSLWTADVLAGLAAARAKVPVRIATVPGEYFRAVDEPVLVRLRRRPLSLTYRLVYRLFDRIIAVCAHVAQDLTSRSGVRLDPQKVTVVPNGVDLAPIPAPASPAERVTVGVAPTERVITTVANFVPMKGYGILVRAVPYVLARYPEARFVLVGGGSGLDAARRLVREAGLEHVVRFLGPRPDARRILAVSDVVVLPSVAAEGLPITVLEALALGSPWSPRGWAASPRSSSTATRASWCRPAIPRRWRPPSARRCRILRPPGRWERGDDAWWASGSRAPAWSRPWSSSISTWRRPSRSAPSARLSHARPEPPLAGVVAGCARRGRQRRLASAGATSPRKRLSWPRWSQEASRNATWPRPASA
jgi:glycosyltransferase involved in cell wall biosynthesis